MIDPALRVDEDNGRGQSINHATKCVRFAVGPADDAGNIDGAPHVRGKQREPLPHRFIAETVPFVPEDAEQGRPVTPSFECRKAHVNDALRGCPFSREAALRKVIGIEPLAGYDTFLDLGLNLDGIARVNGCEPAEIYPRLFWIEPVVDMEKLAAISGHILRKDGRRNPARELPTGFECVGPEVGRHRGVIDRGDDGQEIRFHDTFGKVELAMPVAIRAVACACQYIPDGPVAQMA